MSVIYVSSVEYERIVELRALARELRLAACSDFLTLAQKLSILAIVRDLNTRAGQIGKDNRA